LLLLPTEQRNIHAPHTPVEAAANCCVVEAAEAKKSGGGGSTTRPSKQLIDPYTVASSYICHLGLCMEVSASSMGVVVRAGFCKREIEFDSERTEGFSYLFAFNNASAIIHISVAAAHSNAR
jgi:hypothetical protein